MKACNATDRKLYCYTEIDTFGQKACNTFIVWREDTENTYAKLGMTWETVTRWM